MDSATELQGFRHAPILTLATLNRYAMSDTLLALPGRAHGPSPTAPADRWATAVPAPPNPVALGLWGIPAHRQNTCQGLRPNLAPMVPPMSLTSVTWICGDGARAQTLKLARGWRVGAGALHAGACSVGPPKMQAGQAMGQLILEFTPCMSMNGREEHRTCCLRRPLAVQRGVRVEAASTCGGGGSAGWARRAEQSQVGAKLPHTHLRRHRARYNRV